MTYGKAAVMGSIAAAEAESGMKGSSVLTFDSAIRLAQLLPTRTKDAYESIFKSAVRANDRGAARRAIELWSTSADSEPVYIVYALLHAGYTEDALAYARGLTNLGQRASMLLLVASHLLNEAGAPDV